MSGTLPTEAASGPAEAMFSEFKQVLIPRSGET
jgi:hypothetical protein